MPPFVIFESQRIQHDWVDSSTEKRTVVRVSPNGWTDSSIALEWLEHFDKYTASRTQGLYRLLLLDGHLSHVLFDFV
jgi:hypothetical protein